MIKTGDRFIIPASGDKVVYTIEIKNDFVILMWNQDGVIKRLNEGWYDVGFVERCFKEGSWVLCIKEERRKKLIKIASNEKQ